ncbi:glycoside hydrolase family 28 protein [Marinigracilibium pacificum]|uniref:Glycoside hydrolase family 28 protein n=1 Tax=Marinigracilibium pacificum TaxID=2729599 RepID=A0A848IWB0_9BACT|nr:glycoside hydrolase family 28 protein [Marinigracilibium pacificum]NMM47565.1 glycoside hydrolase family 28 protein [Marinigracilibium pacificum]
MKNRPFYISGLTGIWIIVLFCTITACNQGGGFTVEYANKIQDSAWNSIDQIESRIIKPEIPARTIDIRTFGAKGDSISNDLPVVIQAIDSLTAIGGGKIIFPKGQYYMKGPIHFKSNIELHFEDSARIFFSSTPSDYLPLVKVRWEGTVCYNYSPLIYGIGLKNIALTGNGIIDGAGKDWSVEWRKVQDNDKQVLRQMGNDVIPEEERVFGNGFLDLDGDGQDDGHGDQKQHFLRPTLVEFYESENVLIEGLTFLDSPFWTIHPVFCKNVIIKNLTVFGSVLNDDGVDPDSCEDVLIEGCEIQTHDDAISIKAGRDQDAWNRPGSKNIIIRNNKLLSGVNALCIGSEMSGGVSNVFAENNQISNGKHAINFKCNLDRGGQVQHVYIRNISIDACEDAMFIFRMDYHGYRGNNFPTQFNDFYISDITCDLVEKTPFKIVGVEEKPIEKVFLADINIEKAGEENAIEFATDILFNNVKIEGKEIKN